MELATLLKAVLLPLALGSPPTLSESREHSSSVLSNVTSPRFAGTIRGRVVEAGSGAPIGGATITVNGTRLGAMAGSDGRYVITQVPRGAWREYTARLRPEVSVPVVASNRINSPEMAEEILANGEADLV